MSASAPPAPPRDAAEYYQGQRPVGEAKIPRRVSNPFWGRVLDGVAGFFSQFCHTLGAVFLRVLSTFVLVGSVLGAVLLHILAFYYMGVLNPHPLIAAIFYLPTFAALSLLREEMLKNGTSRSGMGASQDSHAVAVAYLMMLLSSFCSIVHPVWLRAENYISVRSMWTSIGATAWLYFGLLFSSLAYAAALNIYLSGGISRAERRAGRAERYGAIAGAADADAEAGYPGSWAATAGPAPAAADVGVGAGAVPPSPYDEKKESGPYDSSAVAAVKPSGKQSEIESYY